MRVPHRTVRAKFCDFWQRIVKSATGARAFRADTAAPGRTSRERRAPTDAADAFGREHGEPPRVWGAFFERRRSFRREQGEASHRRPRSLPIRGLHPAERPRPRCGQVRATTRALLAFPTDILRLHHPHTPHPRSLPPRARRRDSAPPSPARTFPAHVAGTWLESPPKRTPPREVTATVPPFPPLRAGPSSGQPCRALLRATLSSRTRWAR